MLLALLIACNGAPTDTADDPWDVTLASPASTPEVGEVASYDAIFVGGAPDRVEWFIDSERVLFFDVEASAERATAELESPSASFVVGVEAFYGLDPVSDELEMEAVSNTPPVITITSPTATALSVGEVVSLLGVVEDRTAGLLSCSFSIGGSSIREGQPDGEGGFNAAWVAVAGSWQIELSCTDALGLQAAASVNVDVQ